MVTDEQDPRFFEFASRVLKVTLKYESGCRVLTRLASTGEIMGVVAYDHWTPGNCEMSIASDLTGHWMTREFLRLAFAYPFLQCGLRRVTGVVEEDNWRALNLDTRLGFVFEGRLRKWFGDKDGIVLGMLREECRWIR